MSSYISRPDLRIKLQAGRVLIRTRLPAPQTKPLRTMRPSCKSVASQTVACPQNSRTMVEVHENPQNLQSPSSSTSAADSMGLRRLLMTHTGGAHRAMSVWTPTPRDPAVRQLMVGEPGDSSRPQQSRTYVCASDIGQGRSPALPLLSTGARS
jgi:hypothetical protein